MQNQDELLTSTEVAREIGCSHISVVRWAEAGTIPVAWTTPGGHRRFNLAEVREALGLTGEGGAA